MFFYDGKPLIRLSRAITSQGGVLHGFANAKLQRGSSRNLNGLARSRVAAFARLSLGFHQFAETGEHELSIRLHFARWLNPQHEVFGREVVVATALSFLGVVALSLSLEVLPVPDAWRPFLEWHWP